jgi:hypothetical protein
MKCASELGQKSAAPILPQKALYPSIQVVCCDIAKTHDLPFQYTSELRNPGTENSPELPKLLLCSVDPVGEIVVLY